MKDRIGITGELEVIKIDRSSGKVVEERSVENVLLYEGAWLILGAAYLADEFYCGECATYARPNRLLLLDEGQNVVKQIPNGVASNIACDDVKCSATISWSDPSSDSYTVYYAAIGYGGEEYQGWIAMDTSLYHGAAFSPPLTKSSNEQIEFKWHIHVPFKWILVKPA